MNQSKKEKKPQRNQDVALLQGFFTTLPPWSSFSQWFQNVQFIAAMAVSGRKRMSPLKAISKTLSQSLIWSLCSNTLKSLLSSRSLTQSENHRTFYHQYQWENELTWCLDESPSCTAGRSQNLCKLTVAVNQKSPPMHHGVGRNDRALTVPGWPST